MEREHEQGGLFDAPQELPLGLVYEPGFLTREEEEALIAHIAALPLREARFREYFAKRRVAHFHDGADTPRYDDGDADSFTSGPLPPFLVALRARYRKASIALATVTNLATTRREASYHHLRSLRHPRATGSGEKPC